MFERMEKYQQGCDRNGGSDASNVFWVSLWRSISMSNQFVGNGVLHF